jgi:pilus assembly protein CpaE
MFARDNPQAAKTRVVAQSRDADFERLLRSTFGMDAKVELAIETGTLAEAGRKLDAADATVVIIDLDPTSEADFGALNALTQRLGTTPVIVAIPAFDVSLARQLLQMRVADFVVKPVAPLDLVRACARAAQSAKQGVGTTEAQIYTFLPAAGGVGLTTLASWTSISSTARAATISISNRASTSTRSSRARIASTANCSK